MTTPTLDSGTIDLGEVQKPEKIDLQNNLFVKRLPATNSSTTIALDIFGKTRTITIKGIKTGSEATMKTFVETMDAWANDTTQERKTYVSSLNKSYVCRADSFTYDIYHNRVEYVLVMLEAGVL